MERVCKKCGETKQIEEFYLNKKMRSGYVNACKKCYKDKGKLYYSNNKTKVDIRIAKWKESHKGYYLKGRVNYRKTEKYINYQKDKISTRIKELKDSYIITGIMAMFDLPYKTIQQHPELIENYREQIKVKRLLKSIKNENTKTS